MYDNDMLYIYIHYYKAIQFQFDSLDCEEADHFNQPFII